MSENSQASFDELRLESWEEDALDRTESITDHFNEQARGDEAEQSGEDVADSAAGDSGADQTTVAAASLEREPYGDEAAYDAADDAAQEADYGGGYDGPGM